MNEKEILAMSPGEELNILVARDVMGHKVIKDENLGIMERFTSREGASVFGKVQPYSEDIKVAEQILEKMADDGFEDTASWADFGSGKYTEPEAICKAALLAALKSQKSAAADRIIRLALEDKE